RSARRVEPAYKGQERRRQRRGKRKIGCRQPGVSEQIGITRDEHHRNRAAAFIAESSAPRPRDGTEREKEWQLAEPCECERRAIVSAAAQESAPFVGRGGRAKSAFT